MDTELDKLAQVVHGRLTKNNLQGRTVTVKIKYHDFRQITRSRSFPAAIAEPETIVRLAKELVALTFSEGQRVRLGISLSNFGDVQDQLQLF